MVEYEFDIFTYQELSNKENLKIIELQLTLVSILSRRLVDSLDMETNIVNSGFMSFGFCTGYAPDCELKEYCHCLEIWNKESDVDMDTKLDEGELPF